MVDFQATKQFESNYTMTPNQTLNPNDPGFGTDNVVRLCYIEDQPSNYISFFDNCRERDDSTEDTIWLLASGQHDQAKKDEGLVTILNASNFTQSRIDGVILLQYEYPTSINNDLSPVI